ncbi:MAG: cysteine-rich CWC family protein [Candidatus Omnitrophica bacterium]|nr:cysteine-rich CWC family protein [Candidatus Omnitrophota bacterium]
MNNNALTAKTCEACGKTFSCGAMAGECWCMNVPLGSGILETLRKTYSDCLCEPCLRSKQTELVYGDKRRATSDPACL